MEPGVRTCLTATLFFGLAFSAQAQNPTFPSAGVANAACHTAGTIAPGMLAIITGSNLGPAKFTNCTDPVTKAVPASCNNASVTVNGQAAPVMNSSATQIGFEVPFNVTGSTASMQVSWQTGGQTL